ncbi:MAG: hypothetical protein ACOC1K_02550 [Nanoarchaeota archaeon]
MLEIKKHFRKGNAFFGEGWLSIDSLPKGAFYHRLGCDINDIELANDKTIELFNIPLELITYSLITNYFRSNLNG